MRRLALFALAVALAGCKGNKPAQPPLVGKTEVTAADGTGVNTKLVTGKGERKGIVVMFHQAGSNLHEFDPISPRLVDLGWDCLLVDQRSGGEMWGSDNKTAAQFEGKQSYLDAYQDMEAALEWAQKRGYKKTLVLGSSYSASLVLRLAAEHSGIAGVMCFSPGEYFDQPGLVAGWAAKATAPVFFASTSDEMSNGVMEIYNARAENPAHKMDSAYASSKGVHGASTLREDKADGAAEEYWQHVEGFFSSLTRTPTP